MDVLTQLLSACLVPEATSAGSSTHMQGEPSAQLISTQGERSRNKVHFDCFIMARPSRIRAAKGSLTARGGEEYPCSWC